MYHRGYVPFGVLVRELRLSTVLLHKRQAPVVRKADTLGRDSCGDDNDN